MPKFFSSRAGLSFAEIIMAVGFLAVLTTGLLAIATKTFQFSSQQIDMASAYQHGEEVMESYALKAKDPIGWAGMDPVASPRFSTYEDASGATHIDPRFVYTVKVDELDSDLRFVTVTVFKSDDASANQPTPTPVIDRASPRRGELLRFVNIYQQEVSDA